MTYLIMMEEDINLTAIEIGLLDIADCCGCDGETATVIVKI